MSNSTCGRGQSNSCYVCETQEEFDFLKAKMIKIRTILLEKKDKNMFCKLSSFNKRDKDKFIKEIEEMWNNLSDAEIDEEFGSICCDKLFYQGQDVSCYPVKEMTFADHSSFYNSKSKDDETEELKA
jgi:hypothetical protein